jgi:hypothetical protein
MRLRIDRHPLGATRPHWLRETGKADTLDTLDTLDPLNSQIGMSITYASAASGADK